MKKIHLASFIAVAALLPGCLPYSTGSTEVGLRTVKWSLTGAKGVEDRIYPGGSTQFFVPFLNDWHTFDTRTRVMTMQAARGGARMGGDELVFKTKDGNDIGLDVTISYRIDPAKAPQILQTVATDDVELEENVVRTISRSKPRDIFGELQSEEFYVPANREEKAAQAKVQLNAILEPFGIVVEQVLLNDYRFNEEYMKAIEDKKLADQQVKKLQSETKATEERFKTEVETAKAQVARAMAEADGTFERAKVTADTYFLQQEKISEAIIAEGTAQAEAIEKMNDALSGAGGESLVKMELASALRGKRIVMLPVGGSGLDLRSLDMNKLFETYNLSGGGAPAATPGGSPLDSVWDSILDGEKPRVPQPDVAMPLEAAPTPAPQPEAAPEKPAPARLPRAN